MEKRDLSEAESRDLEFREALRKAAALCSRQEQSTGQIREKLRIWNVDEETGERVIQKLQEEKFLDDSRYARFYVKDKFKLNRWGRIKITVMLRQKGIEPSTIEDALNQIDGEEYYRVCADLIRVKSATLHEQNHFIRKGKLFRFAASHGFESDLIHKILS